MLEFADFDLDLVLVQIQVLYLDLSGQTSFWIGLNILLDWTRWMCSICSIVFC